MKQISPLDIEHIFSRVKKAIEDGETNASIAKRFYTSEASVRRFRQRHGLNPRAFDQAKVEVDGDRGEITTPVSTNGILQDPDQMIRDRGLDPTEWRIADGMRVNQYEGPAPANVPESKITYYQTRFNIERVNPESPIVAPRADGWKAPKKTRVRDPLEAELVVIVGDQQFPWVDWSLHRAFLDWLSYNQPDRGVSLGDSYDFPDIRRGHRVYPQHTAKINECLQTGYDGFRGYVEASPETSWIKLKGNHDDRLDNYLLDRADTSEISEIRRPVDEYGGGERVLGLQHLGRFDELGIELVDTGGSYEQGQVKLSDKLAVRHGWIARKGSGSSALATLEDLRFSIVVGHTHRQGIVYHTTHDIDGDISTLTAAEAGCMCRVSQVPDEDGRIWPGYTTNPDWQQGFMTATIWPDGKFHLDPAIFVNNALLWRDQRYDV